MNLQLAYYSDEFTDSIAVMEPLSRAGLHMFVFLRPPTPKKLTKLHGLRAFRWSSGGRNSNARPNAVWAARGGQIGRDSFFRELVGTDTK